MAEEGAKVALLDVLDDEGKLLERELTGRALQTKYWRCDVSKEAEVAVHVPGAGRAPCAKRSSMENANCTADYQRGRRRRKAALASQQHSAHAGSEPLFAFWETRARTGRVLK
jgi:hypothetical protein